MNILVTGAEGQLGTELVRQAPACGVVVTAPLLAEMDLTNYARVEEVFAAVRPAAVINTAAYTLVDRAETESDLAFAVNAAAPAHLARLCGRAGIPLIQVSTDYVFDGRKQTPYVEDDPIAPLGVYARSKAEGEAAVRGTLREHLIVRTAWLYSPYGSNFVRTILRLAAEGKELRIVDDQVGSPTCAADFAEALLSITGRLRSGGEIPWGTYHYCGSGITSWFGFARHILRTLTARRHIDAYRVVPITTREFPTPARRPAFSALDCSRIQTGFGIRLKPWQASVEQTIDRLLA
ncbi:MAG: dTDP-4-dehydrorhamnose reductase [Desulfobacterales bacterium]|nr:dTDP-4-dehydrorhamnose reductase [Desulfobacterales bacterium]